MFLLCLLYRIVLVDSKFDVNLVYILGVGFESTKIVKCFIIFEKIGKTNTYVKSPM